VYLSIAIQIRYSGSGLGNLPIVFPLIILQAGLYFLLPFFSSRKNCILELKTKTSFFKDIIKSSYRKRIVVAWSLNTSRIIDNEEGKTANLKERIISARECQKAGFVIAFHFDPLIHYSGWENEYEEIIQLFGEIY